MKFTSSVHDNHHHHNPPSRPWSWSLSLGSVLVAEGTAPTAADADAAVDAVIDGLAESLRAARRQQLFPGVNDV